MGLGLGLVNHDDQKKKDDGHEPGDYYDNHVHHSLHPFYDPGEDHDDYCDYDDYDDYNDHIHQ